MQCLLIHLLYNVLSIYANKNEQPVIFSVYVFLLWVLVITAKSFMQTFVLVLHVKSFPHPPSYDILGSCLKKQTSCTI